MGLANLEREIKMPKLLNHQSSSVTKMLLIGDSGAGKTGALASLALAGYNLRIIDTDANLAILLNLLRPHPDALERVDYETLTDPRRNVGGRLVPRKATVWQRLSALIENWKTESAEFGPITTWTERDVLVVDTLSSASRAAMSFVLAMNNRLGQKPWQSDYGDAQEYVRSLLATFNDESVGCNIVVNSHITFVEPENGGAIHGYPNSIGKALAPEIGQYFGSILMAKSTGQGANAKHKLFTVPQGMVELKNSNPHKVKAEYSIETGLADYFKDIQSQSGTA